MKDDSGINSKSFAGETPALPVNCVDNDCCRLAAIISKKKGRPDGRPF
jgi:hypothetical protein